MACPNHNFVANRPPSGTDDPCNNSGEGIFEQGSYWLYDPNQAGADTATNGDCARLFIRTGDTCGVAEWLEIPVLSARFETTDPAGDDCCPAGTVWVNTLTDAVYLSYSDMLADPPANCKWCAICLPDDVVCVTADAADFVVVPPGTATGTTITGMVPATVVVNNPNLSRAMTVTIHWTGSMLFVNSLGVGIAPQLMGHDEVFLNPIFTVAGLPVFSSLARNVGYSVHMYGISFNMDQSSQGWTGCHTIAAGGSVTVAITETLEVVNNATITGLVVQGGSITVST